MYRNADIGEFPPGPHTDGIKAYTIQPDGSHAPLCMPPPQETTAGNRWSNNPVADGYLAHLNLMCLFQGNDTLTTPNNHEAMNKSFQLTSAGSTTNTNTAVQVEPSAQGGAAITVAQNTPPLAPLSPHTIPKVGQNIPPLAFQTPTPQQEPANTAVITQAKVMPAVPPVSLATPALCSPPLRQDLALPADTPSITTQYSFKAPPCNLTLQDAEHQLRRAQGYVDALKATQAPQDPTPLETQAPPSVTPIGNVIPWTTTQTTVTLHKAAPQPHPQPTTATTTQDVEPWQEKSPRLGNRRAFGIDDLPQTEATLGA